MGISIQIFIFNYARFSKALNLFDTFEKLNYDTYLINCSSPYDPDFQETDKILKFPNIYYAGQWNEALKLLNADIMLIINSDVEVPNPHYMLSRIENYFSNYKEAGIYEPNVYWTPWTYNPDLLDTFWDIGYRIVPATDSTIWALHSSIARQVGTIDPKINKRGWAIEMVARHICHSESKLVVRDYSLKCKHPPGSAYSHHLAEPEGNHLLRSRGINFTIATSVENPGKYQLGWIGNDNPEKFRTKANKIRFM